MDNTEISAADKSRLAALERLNSDEVLEYENYCNSGQPLLSIDTNKKLYGLYLTGMTLKNILDLNPGLSIGVLLKARVDGRWDERRDVYLNELLGDMPTKIRQMASEALGFMTLQLAVAHKMHGEKMRLYLQTGDPNDLGELVPKNFRDYRSVIESISRLLDAGKSKGGESSSSPIVNVTASAGSSVTIEEGSGKVSRRFSPEDADAIRAYLEK